MSSSFRGRWLGLLLTCGCAGPHTDSLETADLAMEMDGRRSRDRDGRDVDSEGDERERDERERGERSRRGRDAGEMPPPTEPPPSTPAAPPVSPPSAPAPPKKLVPGARLSTRQVYEDLQRRTLEAAAIAYVPDYPLWSDASEKRRWMILPAGTRVQTDDMDHWRFPVGTRFVKEFSVGGKPIETRVIEKVASTGVLSTDFQVGSFVWLQDLSDAIFDKAGHDNAGGTAHDVPSQKQCMRCHESEPDAVLGFSAVQLSKSGVLARLASRGLLTKNPERTFPVPGNAVEARALGFLHGNCGHCHAAGGTGEDTLRLRFMPHEAGLPVAQTEIYQTTVGVLIKEWSPHPPEFTRRVVPGAPAQSALLYRMTLRGGNGFTVDQMPPIATELRDEEGIAAVRAWIMSLATVEPSAQ